MNFELSSLIEPASLILGQTKYEYVMKYYQHFYSLVTPECLICPNGMIQEGNQCKACTRDSDCSPGICWQPPLSVRKCWKTSAWSNNKECENIRGKIPAIHAILNIEVRKK